MLALIVLLVIYIPIPAFPAWLRPGNYCRASRQMGNLMEYVDDDVKGPDALSRKECGDGVLPRETQE